MYHAGPKTSVSRSTHSEITLLAPFVCILKCVETCIFKKKQAQTETLEFMRNNDWTETLVCESVLGWDHWLKMKPTNAKNKIAQQECTALACYNWHKWNCYILSAGRPTLVPRAPNFKVCNSSPVLTWVGGEGRLYGTVRVTYLLPFPCTYLVTFMKCL